jgi:glycosyltransferase involved in cell wall biosynthesis
MSNEQLSKITPLVSITIPTYNEEYALPFALAGIREQDYPNIEIIIVDSNSTDRTKEVGIKNGATTTNYQGKLLGARYAGLKEAKGDYVLLLDADQVLKKDSIKHAVDMMSTFDMIVFEEDSYEPITGMQKQLARERKLAHKSVNSLNPLKGSLLPRFFKKEILEQVFENIPHDLYPIVVAHDHAIIYFEANKLSAKIGILPNAVSHIEPKSFYEVIVHNYRFGKSTKVLAKTGYYKDLYSNRAFRTRNINSCLKSRTTLLALLRSISYQLGFYMG